MEIIELKVAMDCEKCEKKVRKALMKMFGVESVNVEFQEQKVTVMGYLLDSKKLLKQVKNKTGMHAALWTQQYSSTQQVYGHMDTSFTNLFSTNSDYAANSSNYSNYYSKNHREQQQRHRHVPIYKSSDLPAYNYDYGHSNYRPPTDDPVTTMFSDENPTNCSIM